MMMLSFRPTTAVLRYIETQNISSEMFVHDKTAGGLLALKIRRSPDLIGTSHSILGKQTYTMMSSCNVYCLF